MKELQYNATLMSHDIRVVIYKNATSVTFAILENAKVAVDITPPHQISTMLWQIKDSLLPQRRATVNKKREHVKLSLLSFKYSVGSFLDQVLPRERPFAFSRWKK
jgi:hypothetical protein